MFNCFSGSSDKEPESPAPCLNNHPLFSVAEEGERIPKFTAPATTIPRFRKYFSDDFNFLKLLGKGSFGKVSDRENLYSYKTECEF